MAELLVYELATNCVRHAGSAFDVEVTLTADGARVAVSDDAEGIPAPRSPGPDEATGRGLNIVQALSRDWGVERTPTGKTVWFSLDTEMAEAGGDPLAATASIEPPLGDRPTDEAALTPSRSDRAPDRPGGPAVTARRRATRREWPLAARS